uniref:Dihydrofolate reductase-like protein n=1 Tax=Hypericum perforatum TaxID=65561 RepID=A0A224X4H7_HYPPE
MGSSSSEVVVGRKPRLLCLHGAKTSGEIMKKQVHKWPESVLDKIDLVFVDAPLPAQGKSPVEGIFDPPYFEWYYINKDHTEYTNFDNSMDYIEECIIKYAPIDGLLGFSQGGFIAGALPRMQAQGTALTKVPKIKFVITIGGGLFKVPSVAEKVYVSRLEVPSLHFIGELDYLKQNGMDLVESCVDPVVIHHSRGHTIPRLDEKSLPVVLSFIENIEKLVALN